MYAWTVLELARYLRWVNEYDPDIAMAWRLLVYIGMRRGQALALRWRDVDRDVVRQRGPVRALGRCRHRHLDTSLDDLDRCQP